MSEFEDHALAIDRYLIASKRLASHLVRLSGRENSKMHTDLALELVALCLAGDDLKQLEEFDEKDIKK